MQVLRAYRYRFYPTPNQVTGFAQAFGCTRWIYNWGLRLKTDAWFKENRQLGYNELAGLLPALKRAPETAWMGDVSSVVVQQALRHLETAFGNFFRKKAKYPTFKSRRREQSCTYMANAFKFIDGQIILAKQDEPLAIRWSRKLPKGAMPSSVTVSRTGSGKYHVSILIEEEVLALPVVTAMAGIDMNTGEIVCSSGKRYRTPSRIKALAVRRMRYERACARKVEAAKKAAGIVGAIPKGVRLPVSKNLVKARRKVARVNECIGNVRRDWQHKTSTALVHENQVIALEDLNVAGMTASAKGTPAEPGSSVRQKSGLNRAVLEVGFGEIRRQVEYKGEWYGRTIVLIDRWYPSSKRCSDCGYVLRKLALSNRKWTCPECGTVHDRDLNAANNILGAGLAILAGADQEKQRISAGGLPASVCGASSGGGTKQTLRPTSHGALKQKSASVRAQRP